MTNNLEMKIARKLLEEALKAGATEIRVFDIEGSIYKGQAAPIALNYAKELEMPQVSFKDSEGNTLGGFLLIWGNGEDLISDHVDNEWCNALFNRVAASLGLI